MESRYGLGNSVAMSFDEATAKVAAALQNYAVTANSSMERKSDTMLARSPSRDGVLRGARVR